MKLSWTHTQFFLFLLLLAGLTGLWFWQTQSLGRLAEQQIKLRLERECDALTAALVVDAQYKVSMPALRETSGYAMPDSGHYFSILIGNPQFGQQQFKSISLGKQTLPVPVLGSGVLAVSHSEGPAGHPLLVVSKGYTLKGLPLTISAGESLLDLQHQVFLEVLKVMGLILLIMSLAAGLLLSVMYRVLRPIVELQEDLEEIVSGKTSRSSVFRMPDPGEIERLVQLSTQSLQRSRSAISSLSHLLKTPLAAIIQLANAPAIRHDPDLGQELLTHAESIRNYIQYKLKHAQLAGTASMDTLFNPSQELPGMIQALKAIYRSKSVSYDVNIPDQSFLIDRQDCLELLGNLLDNASKWSTRRVSLLIERCENGLRIHVEDDGPGCSDAEIKILSQPGIWLNKTNPGHGLGLSLVRSIAKLYSGSVEYGRSATLGGLSVSIFLRSHAIEPQSKMIG
jgi:signal transduction histidine kinase